MVEVTKVKIKNVVKEVEPNKILIVGIGGQARVGKTTSAKYLAKEFGGYKLSFADTLKTILCYLYDFSTEQLTTDRKDEIDKRYNLTPRYIMQRFGTDVVRKVYINTWIDVVKRKIENLGAERKKYKFFVIDDVRFANEVEYVKSNGIFICIQRPEIKSSKDKKHSSEQDLSSLADVIIDNNGTIQDLQIKLKLYIEQILSRMK